MYYLLQTYANEGNNTIRSEVAQEVLDNLCLEGCDIIPDGHDLTEQQINELNEQIVSDLSDIVMLTPSEMSFQYMSHAFFDKHYAEILKIRENSKGEVDGFLKGQYDIKDFLANHVRQLVASYLLSILRG